MALRFATLFTYAASVGGGGVLTHGLGATPTEYWIVPTAVPNGTGSIPYFIAASAPDTTAIYVSMGPGARFSAFASVPHSVIQ
jgi:hypothetical protein